MEADMADELGEADVSSEETPEASPREGNEPPTPTMCTKAQVLPVAGGDHSRLRTLVCSAVRTFLSEELDTAEGFSIDGMIGVTTLEQGAMFYVTLSETVPAGEESYTRARRAQRKRKHSVESEAPGDDEETGQPCASPDPLSRASSSSSPSEVVVKQEAEDSSGDAPWYPPQGGTSEARYTPDADDSLPAFPDFSRDHHAYQGVDPGSQWTYPPHHTDPTTATDTVDYRNIPPDLMSPELSYLPRKETPHKRYVLPLTKKVELIEASHGMSHRRLADIFNISKTQVQSILKRKEEILLLYQDETKHDKKALTERVCKMKDVNEVTWMWYQHMQSLDVPISGAQIQRQAMHFARWLGKGEDVFKASNGWLHSFKQRHSIKTFSSPAAAATADKTLVNAGGLMAPEDGSLGNAKPDFATMFPDGLPHYLSGVVDAAVNNNDKNGDAGTSDNVAGEDVKEEPSTSRVEQSYVNSSQVPPPQPPLTSASMNTVFPSAPGENSYYEWSNKMQQVPGFGHGQPGPPGFSAGPESGGLVDDRSYTQQGARCDNANS